MNQSEFLTLMRSDLIATGIDPEVYISQGTTLSILVSYNGKYKELLTREFVKCPYFKKLAPRLSYYLAETAVRSSWTYGPKTIGDAFEQQVDRQAELYGVSGEEFLEWLFSRESADQFMLHLTHELSYIHAWEAFKKSN